ncbi:AT-rich interactive domain-containing protein 3A isoform X2 [Lingula anatina]|uniref:AT-rich interactive domain-containing protein 3A isoform X2 n=1 Tax=Lingula anatina TaxID=7574 RepID=A0A1S3JVI6_LINAN|nr:AT-rich interactive domain-containing protein 3A isoform X2 [Lingula anatina]|eukprot:XP_013414420.1 AT-rich interactive domain-containing protein 3A isoform X2 [Lingula anatina]
MEPEQTESSMDNSASNGSLNGDSDMESSESGSDSETSNLKMNGLDPEKLDPTHREILQKLKRQEQEEKEEIERELKAHKDALARHEELLVRERQFRQMQDNEHAQDLRTHSHSQSDDLRHKRPEAYTHVLSDRSSVEGLSRSPFPYARSPSRSEHLSPNGESPAHHWTFEEQFKQLYELSDDSKRKEFLDELFDYMQKRGTPVNRIPIMAKQTLDLYELFRLVVSKGGLVEVINKKLWREITKGLNLPSSITSAAFTLRTQYMKYLYPFECEKLKLSTPSELQAAIDGNRREGRRPSYGYDFASPGAPTLVPPQTHHLNGGLLNGFHFGLNGSLGAHGLNGSLGSALSNGLNGGLNGMGSGKTSSCGSSGEEETSPTTPLAKHPRLSSSNLSERDALAMEAASRAMEEATRKMEALTKSAIEKEKEKERERERVHKERERERERERDLERGRDTDSDAPMKRLHVPMTEEQRLLAHAGMPSAHLKVTSRSDGRADFDNSLVVSMEINGIMYQGVLFAQGPRRM